MFYSHSSMKRFNVVVAPRNGGKTRYLSSIKCAYGILTKSIDSSKNELYFYDLKSGNTHSFLKRVDERYQEEEGAFEWAEKILLALTSGTVIIDECGKTELVNKRGFYNVINTLIEREDITLYVAVRDSNIELFLNTYKRNWNIIKL